MQIYISTYASIAFFPGNDQALDHYCLDSPAFMPALQWDQSFAEKCALKPGLQLYIL